jgi:uncharacterized membrane protein
MLTRLSAAFIDIISTVVTTPTGCLRAVAAVFAQREVQDAHTLSKSCGVLPKTKTGGVVLTRITQALINVICTVVTLPSNRAVAVVCVGGHFRQAGIAHGTVLARFARALVSVHLTIMPQKASGTPTDILSMGYIGR